MLTHRVLLMEACSTPLAPAWQHKFLTLLVPHTHSSYRSCKIHHYHPESQHVTLARAPLLKETFMQHSISQLHVHVQWCSFAVTMATLYRHRHLSNIVVMESQVEVWDTVSTRSAWMEMISSLFEKLREKQERWPSRMEANLF